MALAHTERAGGDRASDQQAEPAAAAGAPARATSLGGLSPSAVLGRQRYEHSEGYSGRGTITSLLNADSIAHFVISVR